MMKIIFLKQKMTEGFLQNQIKSTLQSLRVAYGNPPSFTREAEMRSPVNVNLTSHGVGRWLAAAVGLLLIYDNLR